MRRKMKSCRSFAPFQGATFLSLIFSVLLLSACASSVPPEFIKPDIPQTLLEPVQGPSLTGVNTEGDLSDALVLYDAALDEANGKILSLANLLE